MSITVYVDGKKIDCEVTAFEPPKSKPVITLPFQTTRNSDKNYLQLLGKPKPVSYRMRRQRIK